MRYEKPATAKEAPGLLAKEKGAAFLLGGGTGLLVKLKMGMVEPDLVVDVKHIAKANEIQTTAKGFSIGAAVPGARLTEHKALTKAWPGVVEAANLIGSDQIQGRCTLAGNLCNASPAADSVPAMIAAGAKAVIVGAKKRRTVPVEKVATGPGQTCLGSDELIESITLPKPGPRTGDAYLRFIPRTEMDIAVVGVAVCVTLERGRVKTARVALGAVAPTAILVPAAARALVGTSLDDGGLEKLARACSAACTPIADKRGTVEYRTRLAGVLAKRAAKIAFARAGGKS